MLKLRHELISQCYLYVQERIDSAEKAIALAREASLDDTKSSAGDKYETTREMMQQEISRNEAQLFEARKLKHMLGQILAEKRSSAVENGSIVYTNNGNFFMSVSAGQLTVEEQRYFAISQASPIGKLLTGLKKGAKFKFNGKEFEILDIQ